MRGVRQQDRGSRRAGMMATAVGMSVVLENGMVRLMPHCWTETCSKSSPEQVYSLTRSRP